MGSDQTSPTTARKSCVSVCMCLCVCACACMCVCVRLCLCLYLRLCPGRPLPHQPPNKHTHQTKKERKPRTRTRTCTRTRTRTPRAHTHAHAHCTHLLAALERVDACDLKGFVERAAGGAKGVHVLHNVRALSLIRRHNANLLRIDARTHEARHELLDLRRLAPAIIARRAMSGTGTAAGMVQLAAHTCTLNANTHPHTHTHAHTRTHARTHAHARTPVEIGRP